MTVLTRTESVDDPAHFASTTADALPGSIRVASDDPAVFREGCLYRKRRNLGLPMFRIAETTSLSQSAEPSIAIRDSFGDGNDILKGLWEPACPDSCRCRKLDLLVSDFAFIVVKHHDKIKVHVEDKLLRDTLIDVIGDNSQEHWLLAELLIRYNDLKSRLQIDIEDQKPFFSLRLLVDGFLQGCDLVDDCGIQDVETATTRHFKGVSDFLEDVLPEEEAPSTELNVEPSAPVGLPRPEIRKHYGYTKRYYDYDIDTDSLYRPRTRNSRPDGHMSQTLPSYTSDDVGRLLELRKKIDFKKMWGLPLEPDEIYPKDFNWDKYLSPNTPKTLVSQVRRTHLAAKRLRRPASQAKEIPKIPKPSWLASRDRITSVDVVYSKAEKCEQNERFQQAKQYMRDTFIEEYYQLATHRIFDRLRDRFLNPTRAWHFGLKALQKIPGGCLPHDLSMVMALLCVCRAVSLMLDAFEEPRQDNFSMSYRQHLNDDLPRWRDLFRGKDRWLFISTAQGIWGAESVASAPTQLFMFYEELFKTAQDFLTNLINAAEKFFELAQPDGYSQFSQVQQGSPPTSCSWPRVPDAGDMDYGPQSTPQNRLHDPLEHGRLDPIGGDQPEPSFYEDGQIAMTSMQPELAPTLDI
ncbi:hypothetical protein Dda_7276 [Drechslerella dactyloides]|uniref:Uncharacterized protein n=1 Tax=Drechslerella dactyloides TaxID=74499 RepID=A0AAD6IVD0_DREDA|nr:hypothetical protein Dda_7276 [Drechslerella dactyloides]